MSIKRKSNEHPTQQTSNENPTKLQTSSVDDPIRQRDDLISTQRESSNNNTTIIESESEHPTTSIECPTNIDRQQTSMQQPTNIYPTSIEHLPNIQRPTNIQRLSTVQQTSIGSKHQSNTLPTFIPHPSSIYRTSSGHLSARAASANEYPSNIKRASIEQHRRIGHRTEHLSNTYRASIDDD